MQSENIKGSQPVNNVWETTKRQLGLNLCILIGLTCLVLADLLIMIWAGYEFCDLFRFLAAKTNLRTWQRDRGALLDISLHAARSFQLVLQQIGVMGRGDEIVTQRLAHVLVEALVLCVKDGALRRAQVHQEAIYGHSLAFFSYRSGGTQRVFSITFPLFDVRIYTRRPSTS